MSAPETSDDLLSLGIQESRIKRFGKPGPFRYLTIKIVAQGIGHTQIDMVSIYLNLG